MRGWAGSQPGGVPGRGGVGVSGGCVGGGGRNSIRPRLNGCNTE